MPIQLGMCLAILKKHKRFPWEILKKSYFENVYSNIHTKSVQRPDSHFCPQNYQNDYLLIATLLPLIGELSKNVTNFTNAPKLAKQVQRFSKNL